MIIQVRIQDDDGKVFREEFEVDGMIDFDLIEPTLHNRILTVREFIDMNSDPSKKILIKTKKNGKFRCETWTPVRNLVWDKRNDWKGDLSWEDEYGEPSLDNLFEDELLEDIKEEGGRYTTTVYLVE